MKPIRMIAVDMDGTLLDSSQQIPKENAQALIGHRRGHLLGPHGGGCQPVRA